ncbi:MAG: FtsX-like permease family protein [Acidothermaceae bacterium]
MSALARVVRGGVTRRKVQTLVMALTALFAVTASVMAAGLLVASNAPFDHAFAKQHGPHLVAVFDGSKATPAKLDATKSAAGVTAAAGPYPVVTIHPESAGTNNGADVGGIPGGALPPGIQLGPLTIAGRANPGGAVDDLTLVHGRWATKPDEIVIASDSSLPAAIGLQIKATDAPGSPTFTVVGVARSVAQTADAWVIPDEARTLASSANPLEFQMLYRFSSAQTDDDISADRRALTAASPPGALTGTQSYLATKKVADANTAAFVPFIAAFGVLGLVLAVLIIGIVVSGAVGAAIRRIGVLKALGFTPAQVVRAYVAQALLPALIGIALGVLFGNLLAVPVLHGAEGTYGTAGLSIPLWVNVLVPLLAAVLVAIAAVVPALRAGRLRAAEAIALGATPKTNTHGRRMQRLASRLPFPRAISLGLANPLARPARSAATGGAVLFGAIAITFAFGLTATLNNVQQGRDLDSAGQVIVRTESFGPNGPHKVVKQQSAPQQSAPQAVPTQADPNEVAAAIAAQPGTRSFYGTTEASLAVAGLANGTDVIAYQGDSSWATHQMIEGHWLTAKGQAVLSSLALQSSGLRVGDEITLSNGGRSARLQVVGEVLDLHDSGIAVFTDTSTFSAIGIPSGPDDFHVALKDGTSLAGYLEGLKPGLLAIGADADPNPANKSDVIETMDALIATLTIMLVAVAGLGVLNAVVLETRDRTHDLGVLKSLGMTPRQTIASVITSVAGIGLLAGVIGVPLGVALHHYVVPIMGRTVATKLPSVDVAVYHAPTLVALVFGGLVIAVAGALLPAGWAAKIRTATALRTE